MGPSRDAGALFDDLSARDAPAPADAVIGLGHSDLKIPGRCHDLSWTRDRP